MLFLRQSTASQEVLLGPFVDDTDGKTAQTGLTIANTDIKLWVEGGTTEANKTSGGATHIASGRYYAVLDATDTATVGKLEINVHVAGALPVRREFHVLEETVYDSLFAASAAGYQVPIWAAANSTVNLSGTTVKAVTDKVAATIAAGDIATDAVDAASVKADAVTKIQNGLATPTNITAGTITTVTNLTNAPTAGDLTATMKTSVNTEVAAALATYDGPTNAEMVARTIAAADYATAAGVSAVETDTQDIQSRLPAALTGDGNIKADTLRLGGTLQTGRDIGASVLLSNGTGTGQVKLASGYVAMTWADIAAPTTTVNLSGTTIKTATDVETDTADIQTRIPAALTGAGNMKADALAFDGQASGLSNFNDFIISGWNPVLHSLLKVDVATTAEALGTQAKADVNTEADTALADYDAPTNAEMVARTLATADYATATDLGTVDTVVDAIKVKTDQFVFTVANQVDANALSGGGGLDAAGVRAAVGLASANLDTQLAAIDDYLDTEVAAIKAKTDLLTTFPANFSSLSIDSTGFVGANVTNSGTAAAGSSSSLTLSASASTTNSYYVRQYVQIVSGTGAGQVRQVAAYTGSTKVVTVNFAWVTNPDNTSVYRIIAAHVPHVADNAGVTRAKDENDVSLATAASLNTVDDFLDTEVAAILAAVDTEVGAIKTKTDQLTFTVANQVDANALSGGGSGLDAAGVRSALGMSSANLDTQLADLPTVAEFEARTIASASYATATALGTTDTAVQTLTTRVGIPAVSVSDDLAAVPAAVRTELTTELGRIDAAVSTRATPAQVATELATYDGPTNAEMVARTLPAASYAEPGDAMTLTTGERTAVANEVETQIIDDTDSEKVLEAIVNKIAAANPSLEDLTLAAIASAVRTELATELARIDAAITTRLASASYTAPPSASTNASAVRMELTTELGRIDAAITTRATPAQVATELATYDGPTNAEMEARTLPSASYAEPGDEMTLADSEDVYPADIGFTIDDSNSRDEYTVVWFRNGAAVTSGITVPTIQAIKRVDGTNLIPSSVMTQIGSSGAYKYDAVTTERATPGEAVVVVVSATINGSTRTWRKVITRDVEVVA